MPGNASLFSGPVARYLKKSREIPEIFSTSARFDIGGWKAVSGLGKVWLEFSRCVKTKDYETFRN